jgi:hypothetical protein
MKVDFDSRVGRTLGKRTILTPRVGIELEYEGVKVPIQGLTPLWWTDIDHSLRTGGVEIISKPLRRNQIADEVATAVKVAKMAGAKVTPRCGLHVHVNATQLTWSNLYKFVVYYTLMEPQIFADMAPGRENSHFCVPTWTNTALTEYMYNDGQKLRSGINIPGCKSKDWAKAAAYITGGGGIRSKLMMIVTPKYAALNMSSLKKFGTLEFRQAPSSLDPMFITRWANLLLDIQEESARYDDATDVVRAYDKYGLVTLCEKVGYHPAKKVEKLDQEDAVDTATIIAGHIPVNWQQLKWEVA